MKKETKIMFGAAALILLVGGYAYTRQNGVGLDATSMGSGGGFGGGGALSFPEPQTQPTINLYWSDPIPQNTNTQNTNTPNSAPATKKTAVTQNTVGTGLGDGGIGGGFGGSSGGARGDPATPTQSIINTISKAGNAATWLTPVGATMNVAKKSASLGQSVGQSVGKSVASKLGW